MKSTSQTQNTLSALSNKQLNAKLAKFYGWKLVDGKWWHDDLGDGPPMDACAVFGRVLVEGILSFDDGEPEGASGASSPKSVSEKRDLCGNVTESDTASFNPKSGNVL